MYTTYLMHQGVRLCRTCKGTFPCGKHDTLTGAAFSPRGSSAGDRACAGCGHIKCSCLTIGQVVARAVIRDIELARAGRLPAAGTRPGDEAYANGTLFVIKHPTASGWFAGSSKNIRDGVWGVKGLGFVHATREDAIKACDTWMAEHPEGLP